MDEESRGRAVTNLIRTLSPKIGVQILPADVRVVTRRHPKPNVTDPTAPSGIRLPTTTGSVILRLARRETAAEYEADTDAYVNAVICPPTRLLLALLEVREVWKARRSADSVHLKLLDLEAARLLWDVCRNAVLALPFGDLSRGRAVIQFFRCALPAKAIRTGPLANLELPTVEQLAEAIAATISHRINTPPELQHAQLLTDTMTAAGVEMYHHHTELTLLRVGDDNLCAISLGQEDDEFADTMRLAVALTSHVALLLWAIRLRTIVIYLTESKFDPSELLIHPFSQTIREAGELGGNTGHNQIRLAAIGLRKKARKTTPASLALRATGCPIYTLTLPDPTDTSNDPNSPDRTLATAPAATAMPGAHADDEEKLELNYEENDNAMEVDTTHAADLASLTAESHQLRNPQRLSIQMERHPSQPTPTGNEGQGSHNSQV
eukprot:jgi/Tetstr1/465424/TSEL_010108.t1